MRRLSCLIAVVCSLALISRSWAADAERTLAELASPLVHATLEDPQTASTDLRSAKVALVIVPGPPRTYRYDDTRPEARLARVLVDDVLQRAEGRA